MRSVTLVLAFAAVCAASPVLAQARVMTVQDQAQPPQLGPPPATIPALPQQAQNHDATPAPPPQAAPPQMQPPPPLSAQPKTQERVQSTPQPAPAPAVSSRYSFNRVDDGFLRLDHVTGQLAYCSPHTAGWGCQAVAEDRAALEKEITRLQDEVAGLKNEIAALRAPPPPPRPPAPIPPPAAAPDKNGTIKLPSDQDLARARAYIADTWRRLVDMINQFQQDMMRKRDSDSANGPSRT